VPARVHLSRVVGWSLLLAAGAPPGDLHASELDVAATTLSWTRPVWAAGDSYDRTFLIQRLSLSGRRFDLPLDGDLDFQISAWGRLGFGLQPEPVGEADVEIAKVHARFLQRRLSITAGRQLVVGGAARILHLDGARADYQLANGLGLSAYGGLDVAPRFAEAQGDAAVGGRLYWRASWENELGVSAVQILDHGLVARRDAGIDGRWALTRQVWLDAALLWSLLESRLADGHLSATWSPWARLLASADVRRRAPDLYLSRTSIFSVFAEEERDAIGGMVAYDFTDRLGTAVDYHLLRIEGETGHDASARADWKVGPLSTVGLQARYLTIPANGYVQVRAWTRHALTRGLWVTANVDGTWLEEPVNGERRALVAGASVTWTVVNGLNAHLSGLVGSTPLFALQSEVIARLSYDLPSSGIAR
jgi:hypothetical protein